LFCLASISVLFFLCLGYTFFMSESILIIPFIFLVGTVIGSFLNVVIDRWPKEKSVIKNRSHCDFCKTNLLPKDLIPVVSFLLLKGRCRYCRKKLSWQYPLVEFFTGFLFIATVFLTYQNGQNTSANNFLLFLLLLIFNLIIAVYFILIFMIDLKYEIILDNIIDSVIVISVVYQVFVIFFSASFFGTSPIFSFSLFYPIAVNLLIGCIIALFFRFLIFVSRGKGLGVGDIKLGFWLGVLLGFNAIPAFFIGFVSGAVVGLFLVITKIKRFGQTIPLAPFLVSGAYIAFFFGDKIIRWYITTFL